MLSLSLLICTRNRTLKNFKIGSICSTTSSSFTFTLNKRSQCHVCHPSEKEAEEAAEPKYLLHVKDAHTFCLGSSHVMWNTMMPSVKLLTEIPAMSKLQTLLAWYEHIPDGGRWHTYHHVALTFESGVQHSLFDLGFLYHIGSCLGEDELPWPWFETIPIIFNNRDAVLQRHRTQRSCWAVFDVMLCFLWVRDDILLP